MQLSDDEDDEPATQRSTGNDTELIEDNLPVLTTPVPRNQRKKRLVPETPRTVSDKSGEEQLINLLAVRSSELTEVQKKLDQMSTLGDMVKQEKLNWGQWLASCTAQVIDSRWVEFRAKTLSVVEQYVTANAPPPVPTRVLPLSSSSGDSASSFRPSSRASVSSAMATGQRTHGLGGGTSGDHSGNNYGHYVPSFQSHSSAQGFSPINYSSDAQTGPQQWTVQSVGSGHQTHHGHQQHSSYDQGSPYAPLTMPHIPRSASQPDGSQVQVIQPSPAPLIISNVSTPNMPDSADQSLSNLGFSPSTFTDALGAANSPL